MLGHFGPPVRPDGRCPDGLASGQPLSGRPGVRTAAVRSLSGRGPFVRGASGSVSRACPALSWHNFELKTVRKLIDVLESDEEDQLIANMMLGERRNSIQQEVQDASGGDEHAHVRTGSVLMFSRARWYSK